MTDSAPSKRAPNADTGWSTRAKRVWSETFRLVPVDGWRPDEIELMRLYCQSITDVSVIETALIGADLVVPGSHGGRIANPLLSERRQLNALILSIQKALKLPLMDEITGKRDSEDAANVITMPNGKQRLTPSERGKRAAAARWSNRRDVV